MTHGLGVTRSQRSPPLAARTTLAYAQVCLAMTTGRHGARACTH
jgi:hypothetical protein